MLEDIHLPEGYVDVSTGEDGVPVVSITTEPEHYPPEVHYGAIEASWEAFTRFGEVRICPRDDGADDYAGRAFNSVIAGYRHYEMNPVNTLRKYLRDPGRILDVVDPRRSTENLDMRIDDGCYSVSLVKGG